MATRLLIVAMFLGACTAPAPRVAGRYATALSSADVQQIEHLVETGPQEDRTITKLWATDRDRVWVDAGHYHRVDHGYPTNWVASRFLVVRRNGLWQFDENSPVEFTTDRIIRIH
jgi:hypothetical protein